MPWTNRTKNAEATSTLKTKIPQQADPLFILTPDNNYILVGSSEDLFLIYREGYNNWELKAKIES